MFVVDDAPRSRYGTGESERAAGLAVYAAVRVNAAQGQRRRRANFQVSGVKDVKRENRNRGENQVLLDTGDSFVSVHGIADTGKQTIGDGIPVQAGEA